MTGGSTNVEGRAKKKQAPCIVRLVTCALCISRGLRSHEHSPRHSVFSEAMKIQVALRERAPIAQCELLAHGLLQARARATCAPNLLAYSSDQSRISWPARRM